METQIVQQPMIIIALSPREAKAALEDPAQLQSAIRREWLNTQGHAPLALPAASANGHGKPRKVTRKMGGGKGRQEITQSDARVQAVRQGVRHAGLPGSAYEASPSERGSRRAGRR